MFWLYREHNVLPSTFYALGEGEKIILHAFMTREVENIKEREKNNG